MPHAYTEDQLVEQPAMRLLVDLGWSLAQPHPHPRLSQRERSWERGGVRVTLSAIIGKAT